jgi:hypothetical protein
MLCLTVACSDVFAAFDSPFVAIIAILVSVGLATPIMFVQGLASGYISLQKELVLLRCLNQEVRIRSI